MRNAVIVSTSPYEVKKSDGSLCVLDRRFMGKSELEDLICKVIARGNIAVAARIKLVHRRTIKDVTEYMMSILGGRYASSELIRETLKQALLDLEINVRDLVTITPEQVMEAKRNVQNNRGRSR